LLFPTTFVIYAGASILTMTAYTAAMAYFTDSPSGKLSHSILDKYGLRLTENVKLTFWEGTVFSHVCDNINTSNGRL